MNEKLYDLIEDYNLGRLKPPQLEAFEAALATDAALAAAVRIHRAEWEMRELLAENTLRAQIRQGFVEQPPHQPWVLKNWKWTLLTLLFLGVAGVLFFQKTPEPTARFPENVPSATPSDTVPVRDSVAPLPSKPDVPERPTPADLRKYAMAAYEMPESLSGLRGAGSEDTLGLAQAAFAEKNYRRVLQLLNVLPAEERQEALLLRAHAAFGAGQFDFAFGDFNQLKAGNIYRREAQWFFVLSGMAGREENNGNQNMWLLQLNDIRKDSKHPYQKQAEALWQKIKR